MPRQAAPLIVFAVHESGTACTDLRELWSAYYVQALCEQFVGLESLIQLAACKTLAPSPKAGWCPPPAAKSLVCGVKKR